MDLILSKDPSTDAHVMQLEPAKMQVDPLVQRGKVLSMSIILFVSKHFRFLAFQHILGLISYLCVHPFRLIHLINPTLWVLSMRPIRMRLSSRFGDRKKKILSV